MQVKPRRAKGGQESRPELGEEETGLAQEEAELGLLEGEWWVPRGLVMQVAWKQHEWIVGLYE